MNFPFRHCPSGEKEDILIFANHFLDKANEELGKQVAGFDEEVMRIFRTYSWPGNLREMRNIVKRATLLCMGSLISKTCLPPELEQNPWSLKRHLQHGERWKLN